MRDEVPIPNRSLYQQRAKLTDKNSVQLDFDWNNDYESNQRTEGDGGDAGEMEEMELEEKEEEKSSGE